MRAHNIISLRTNKTKNALKMYVYNIDDKEEIAVFDWLISACIKFCLQHTNTSKWNFLLLFSPFIPKTILCPSFCHHQQNQLDCIAKDSTNSAHYLNLSAGDNEIDKFLEDATKFNFKTILISKLFRYIRVSVQVRMPYAEPLQ